MGRDAAAVGDMGSTRSRVPSAGSESDIDQVMFHKDGAAKMRTIEMQGKA